MRWEWDSAKNRINRQKHRLSFETAIRVFEDGFHVSKRDEAAEEERWLTMGDIDGVLVVVVHTSPARDHTGEEVGRIISARKATSHERKAYEEGDFER